MFDEINVYKKIMTSYFPEAVKLLIFIPLIKLLKRFKLNNKKYGKFQEN